MKATYLTATVIGIVVAGGLLISSAGAPAGDHVTAIAILVVWVVAAAAILSIFRALR